jgi:sulfate adenylyltransferase subunit 1 (EFTu-like GTPase family)
LTHTAEAIVDEILDVVDVRTLERGDAPAELGLNDIGRIRLRTRRPLLADPYARNRVTGAFILIDESNNDTVAGGMIA